MTSLARFDSIEGRPNGRCAIEVLTSRFKIAVAAGFDPTAPAGGGLRVSPLAIRADGSTGDAVADAALRTARVVDRVLVERFERDGIDGAGGTVELIVHAPDRFNAYWDRRERRVELGDGDGEHWGNFGASVTVVAHEMYHGVIEHEVVLDTAVPEQAALHESLADVFAAGVAGTWRIGEDVLTPKRLGDAIRDLAHPELTDLRAVSRDDVEVHALSGVASLAAVRAAAGIGGDAMQRLWYDALVRHLPDGAGFLDAARATSAAAAARYGSGSREQLAVQQAWESVGVLGT